MNRRQGQGPPRVANGLDVLAAERFARLRDRRVGAIANSTSIDHRVRHLAGHLNQAQGVGLTALSGPKHDIGADAQGKIGAGSSRDSRTRVPVHSLYGSDAASLTPAAAQLEGVDCLFFNGRDADSRYYTFATTMLYAMRADETSGLGFVVLDRPSPIGGDAVEGPIPQPGFESFVGPHPIPTRHGSTVGELALLYRDELRLDLDLQVVACQGWTRSMRWPDTGFLRVSPSPNTPTPETVLAYPETCLIERTNLSEGRGTTRSFELWEPLDRPARPGRASPCAVAQRRPRPLDVFAPLSVPADVSQARRNALPKGPAACQRPRTFRLLLFKRFCSSWSRRKPQTGSPEGPILMNSCVMLSRLTCFMDHHSSAD